MKRAPYSLGFGRFALLALGCTAVLFASSCQESQTANDSSGKSSESLDSQGTIHARLEGGAADVAAIRFEIWKDGSLLTEQTSAMETEPTSSDLVPDAPNGKSFADALFVLPDGTYDVRTVPLTASGAPSTACMPAEKTGVVVVAGKTNEIVIIMSCNDKPTGGLDVVGVLTDAPVIVDVMLKPSKFIETCQKVVLFAAIKAPEDTYVTITWEIVSAPVDSSYKLVEFGPKAIFAAETAGNYTVKVTAKTGSGGETSLTLPIHVSQSDLTSCLDNDSDSDGIPDPLDACPNNFDPGQEDSDNDGEGDVCDPCPGVFNAGTIALGDKDPAFGSTLGKSQQYFSDCGGHESPEVAYALDLGDYSGDVVVTTDGSAYDTVVTVGLDCNPQSATLACNDDDQSTQGLQSRVAFSASPSTLYVMVDGANAQAGQYRLSARAQTNIQLPASCSEAITLTPGDSVSGYMAGLPMSQGTGCLASEGESTELAIEVPTKSDVLLHTFGSSFDTVLSLRKKCGDGATEIACNDNVDCTAQSQIALSSLEPGTYFLHVASAHPISPNAAGFLVATYQAFPAGKVHTCDDPLNISKPGIYGGTTMFSPDQHDGFHCSLWRGPEQVHQLDIPAGGAHVVLDTQGSSFDTTLYVRSAQCGAEDQEVACNEDYGQSHQARVEMDLEEGTYFVFVDGFENARGAYRLLVEIKSN